MNLDSIVGEEEEESPLAYSPLIFTLQQEDQQTLAHILREMEISWRKTFDQLRANMRQSEIML